MNNYKQTQSDNNNWKGGKQEYSCLECGESFLAYASERKRGGAKFCTRECGYENKRRRTWIVCEYCGKEHEKHTYEVERGGKFCSSACAGKSYSENIRGEKHPVHGTKHTDEWKKNNSIRVKEMWEDSDYRKSRSGENNPAWKGGITPENKLQRTSAKAEEWRKSVYTRDDYTCIKCGQRGGDKHAHHILSFSGYPEERFAVDNGITVCLPCHGELHGWSEGDSRSGARL